MNPMIHRTILLKSITFAYVHLLGNKSKLGLDSKVVIKVGGISPWGDFERQGGENTKRGDWGTKQHKWNENAQQLINY